MADINVVVDSPPNYPVVIETPAKQTVTIAPPPAITVTLDNGRQGPPGTGIPTGGTTNQVLAKRSSADYDTQWINNNSLPEVSAGVAAPTTAPATIPAVYLQETQPHPILWAYYSATVGWETIATGTSGVDQFRQLIDVIWSSTTTNTYSSDTVGVQQIIGLRQTSATTWVIDYSGAQIGGLQVGNLISATNTGNPILYTIGNLFWAGNVGAITVNKDPAASWSLGTFSIYKVTQTTTGPADKTAWWYRTASDKLEAFDVVAEIRSVTTNTLSSDGNVLTSTVNGVAATANTVKTNAIVKPTSNQIETAVNSVGSNIVNIVDTVAVGAGTAAGTSKVTVNGVSSNDFTAGITIAQVDAEIAAKVGSINQVPTTLVTTGLQTTTGAFGTQGSVTTCNIATASHDAGRTFLTSIGCTLSGTTWSAPTNPTYIGISATPNANAVAMILGAQDANNILQLDLQTNAVLAALHSGPYTLFSATGLFNFQAAPLAAIDREIAARTSTNEGIFNLAQPLNADNVGLLVKIVSTSSALSNVVGSVNNSADFGAVTITSAGFPPTPPTGFNTQYVGISSADNRTWGGVGRIASGNTGIEQIAWKIAPPANLNFTDARIWSMVDEAASSWVGQTLSQSQDNGPVTSHLFPEATVTYTDDNLGTYNGAANITYKPFVDNEIASQLVAGTSITLDVDSVTKRVTINSQGGSGSGSPFVTRYDYPYASKTSLGVPFLGYLTSDSTQQGNGTLTLSASTSNRGAVTNATITGLPSGLVDGSSVVAFGPSGQFDVTEATIGLSTPSPSAPGGLVSVGTTGLFESSEYPQSLRLSSGTLLASTGISNLRTSTDNGTTWSAGTTLPSSMAASGVAQLANGNIVVCGGAQVAVSTNNTGTSWPASATNISGVTELYTVTRLSNGTLLSGGRLTVSLTNTGKIARSTDGGATWSVLSPASTQQCYRMLQLANGDVIAVVDISPSGSGIIRSTDNGATWSAPVSITGVSFLGTLTQLSNGNVLFAGNGLSTSTDNGVTWSTPTTFSGQFAWSTLQVGTDVFLLSRGGTSPNQTTAISRSTDNGATWGAFTQLLSNGSNVVLPVAPILLPNGSCVVITLTLTPTFNQLNQGFTVTGLTGSTTLTGTLNTTIGTPVSAGTYNVFFSGVTGAGVSSLNSLTGGVNITSPDSSVTVGTSGNAVTLSAATPSVAGVATGYNVGVYDIDNMTVAGGNVPSVTAANEGLVVVGSGTGYSTNTSVIATHSTFRQLGWTFGGQKVNNTVFELGTQKQRFRLGVSGTWNGSLPVYGDSAVIKRPIVLGYGIDFDGGQGNFPGLVTVSGSAAPLVETSTVTPVARYCTNTGFTVNTNTYGGQAGCIGLVSLAEVSGAANTPVVIFTVGTAFNSGNTGDGVMTLPLEVYTGGQWIYLGAEWRVSNNLVVTPTQVQLTLPGFASYDGLPVRILNGNSTPLLAWFDGLPPNGTVFGSVLTSAQGYVEVYVPPNTWVADSATYKPQGFNLPNPTDNSGNGYNFTWVVISSANRLNTLDYWHYTGNDQYAAQTIVNPEAPPNWNNRITINYGSSGSSIPGNLWSTWTDVWDVSPVELVTDNTASDGANTGNVVQYIYKGVTRYRFIPSNAVYPPSYDAFYSTFTGNTVSNLLTARSS